MRVKIKKISDINYYLERAGTSWAEYYLTPASAGKEPPGIWLGQGARDLGLSGLVKPDVMRSLYERHITPDGQKIGRKRPVYQGSTDAELAELAKARVAEEIGASGPFITEERIAQINREVRAQARHGVLGWDFTFSAPKSVSVTHAGWITKAAQAQARGDSAEAVRCQEQANLILDAIRDTTAELISEEVEPHLYVRTEQAGAACRDARGAVVASFLQGTNRDNDPHIHTHNILLNEVQRADGADETWRTPHGDALIRLRGRLDAIGQRKLAGKMELLGYAMVQRPDGGGFEVGGVAQDTIDACSSRKVAVEQGAWVPDPAKKRQRGCGCPCERGEQCGGCGHDRCKYYLAPGLEALVQAWTAQHGRPPSRSTLWTLHEVAFRSTRPKKSEDGLTQEQLLALWEQRAAEHQERALAPVPDAALRFAREHRAKQAARPRAAQRTHGATRTAQRVLGADCAAQGADGANAPGADRAAQRGSEARVLGADGSEHVLTTAERHKAIRVAVAEVSRQNATWRLNALAWEIGAALPPLTPDTDPAALMDQCLREAIGNEVPGAEVAWLGNRQDVTDITALGVRKSDGRPVYWQPPECDKYASVDTLDDEQYLLLAGGRRVRPKMTSDEASSLLEGSGLSDEQLSAAAMMLSTDRPTVAFVGPPGSGKSYTLGVAARAYIQATGRRVIGLALAKNAVRVLQSEGIEEAYTIADFLGQLKDGGRRGHIKIGPGDILVIDESSQVHRSAQVELQSIASEAGAWTVWAGDIEQLPSPEAGGMMRLVASEYGFIQIREVRRFAEQWERAASLRLRDGDVDVITEYKEHGRIQEGRRDDMQARAVRNWLGDHLAGLDTLLLAGSNAEAAELSAKARHELIKLGEVRNSGDIRLERDDNDASVGDLLRARQNSRIAAGGKPLENRDVIKLEGWWTGGLHRQALVRRQLPGGKWTEQFPVPEDYVREHTELAYAGNVDVSEGRTVDTGHELVTSAMTRARHLVGATRGRQRNTWYVVTSEPAGRDMGGDQPAPELIREYHQPSVTAESVLESILTREPEELTATEVLRQAENFPTSMPRLHMLWKTTTREACFPAYDRALKSRIRPDEYERYLKEDQRATLHHQLRRAELAGADVTAMLDQVTAGPLTGAESIAAVIHGRIEKLHLPEFGHPGTYAEQTPEITDPDRARIARATAAAMDQRQLELGEDVARRPPVWAVRYLGMPPREPGALRQDWVRRAGVAAGYRELRGFDDPVEAIGDLRAAGSIEKRTAWAAAARALEMREEETDVRMASRGALEAVVQAYERVQAWAPEYVADRLKETEVEAQNTRAKARVAAARANQSGLDRDQARAERTLAQAEELDAKRALLNEIQGARREWAEHTETTRQKANVAAQELERRVKAEERVKVKATADADQQPQAAAQPRPQTQPQPERSDEELADLARLARERIQMERDQEERDPWEKEPWRDQAEDEKAATWQPGRYVPETSPEAADTEAGNLG